MIQPDDGQSVTRKSQVFIYTVYWYISTVEISRQQENRAWSYVVVSKVFLVIGVLFSVVRGFPYCAIFL
jgi:hypothetical protein